MMFRSCALAALVAVASASERQLSFQRIAGYEPSTNVFDHAAIDQDQRLIETLVGEQTSQSFNAADAVYRNGGNSKSYAAIQLKTSISNSAGKGTLVVGMGIGGEPVDGTLLENVESGATQLKVQYKTSDVPESHVGCRVGGLPAANQLLGGCFIADGTIEIDGESYEYTYNTETDNKNARTIRGFSTNAKEKMYDCPNCPYPEYEKFYEYYGVPDYADKWISAAFDGTSTSGFDNYNANFGQYSFEGRAEAAKKGTAYMSIHMYVIREMRDAVDDCNAGKIKENDDAVVAWDEAVAFYTGSLEGTTGAGVGSLMYNLADKRCQDFKTCGENGNELSGLSKVNRDIFALFSEGQGLISNGKCDVLEQRVNRISQLMYVPLIQGTIRYAHKVGELAQGEKAKAEGAVFAASVLPIVASCSIDDAAIIASSMQVGASQTDYSSVVNAFQRQYGCMGISSAEVGGLWDSAANKFVTASDSGASAVSVVAAIVGTLATAIFMM